MNKSIVVRYTDQEQIQNELADVKNRLPFAIEKVLRLESIASTGTIEDHKPDQDSIDALIAEVTQMSQKTYLSQLDPFLKIVQGIESIISEIHHRQLAFTQDTVDCLIAAFNSIQKWALFIEEQIASLDSVQKDIEITVNEDEFTSILGWIHDVQHGIAVVEKNSSQDKLPDNLDEKIQDMPQVENLSEKFEKPNTLPIIQITPQMVNDFISEALDDLKVVEDTLLTIEAGSGQFVKTYLDNTLRGFHSIKGNAGLLISLIKDKAALQQHIVNKIRILTHSAESLVQAYRDNQIRLSASHINLLLKICDQCRDLLEAFYHGDTVGKDISELLRACESAANYKDNSLSVEELFKTRRNDSPLSPTLAALENTLTQFIESISKGVEEVSENIGNKTALNKIKRGLQSLKRAGKASQLDTLMLLADEGLDKLKQLTQADSKENSENELLFLKSIPKRIYEIVLETVNLPLPVVETESILEKPQDQAIKEKQTEVKLTEKSTMQSGMIKVPQERIDQLMNLIGELIVSKNTLIHLARSISVDEDRPDIGSRVKDSGSVIGRIGDELQACIMKIRMTPVNHVFSRFPRLVRDLSHETKKQIDIVIVGEDTELDKTLIEAIGTPLVHLIRNAVDHGIESPDERVSKGKPAKGIITLKAYNEGQNVVIEVSDDGRGIDTAVIKNIAVQKRILDQLSLENMTEIELQQLIFHPGFSSAKTVTDISGRGVGMDVVRKEIEGLGGTVVLLSQPEKGTTITLRLPLTLAVNQGLKVEVNNATYYLPLSYVNKTVKIPDTEFHILPHGRMVVINGDIFIVKHLGILLGLATDIPVDKTIRALVIIDVLGRRFALEVDRFYREEEYVIKTIGGALGDIPELIGATITSEGKVILVINPLKLI
ncbi:MAG: chemotaxis protein CheA [Desulfobacterales bacterium]|nr:chemotaxis protein CheA [Desulfobacterales bacterium]